MKRRKQILAWLLLGTMMLTNVIPLQASGLETEPLYEAGDSTETEIQSEETEQITELLILEETESQEWGTEEVETETETKKEIAKAVREAPMETLYLSFEDSLADGSTIANSVTAIGTEQYTEGIGKGGKAFYFDGDTYLNLGNSEYLTPSSLTASFWIKPDGSMGTGEQMLVWNKAEYNSDGWYMGTQQSKPLVMSVGPGDSQPYCVSVSGNRDEFFPAGEWTHIGVTFDEMTKEVSFYRNGVKQAVQVDYGIGGSSTGVIGSGNTIQKSIGWNGSVYQDKNTCLKNLALDEFTISNYAKEAEEISAYYEAEKPNPYRDQLIHLSFEGDLADSSDAGIEVTARGTAIYRQGVTDGSLAFQFDGDTYLDMGTSATLNPASLTAAFWVNPETEMTDEQVFVWNKEAYNSDGWYIASENDDTPIVVSIGDHNNNGQPYKVIIEGSRNSFFPVGEWTHVAVTFDEATKEVIIYRNGVPQTAKVSVNYGNGASGVIQPDNMMLKSLGWNGPEYGGSFARVGMDEFILTDAAMTPEEVIGVYEECRVFAGSVLQSDYDLLTLPKTTIVDLKLPAAGQNGSTITWKSSDEQVITSAGEVTVPELDSVDVTMTATLEYDGQTKDKVFELKVVKPNFVNNAMDNVTLSDSYLVNAESKEYDYLLSMDSEKFLYEFYRIAGLEPTTDSGYGGWERNTPSSFRGHFFGHYMSALSQGYLSSKDTVTQEALLTEIQKAVAGLKKCQDAYAEKYPDHAGYISAFPENVLHSVDGAGYAEAGGVSTIVPYYNLHKVLAGLIDIARNVQGDIGKEALQTACGLGDYLYNRSAKMNKDVMLRTEYGGMNEALYDLYYITENQDYADVAWYFDETALFEQLAAGKDVLNGKHANTTIPKFIGAVKRYQVMAERGELTETENRYLQAAENFWDIVINDHSYITGGNSRSEHFKAAGSQGQHADNVTCETCNTYNMLKLSRALFQITGDKKYMDYYENTYINAILSSQNPETGMTMYFQPMAPGYYKLYSTPYDSFWCCTGTGVENFTKLGDTIYLNQDGKLYVNMFFSSTYDNGNISITQMANMPNEDVVKFTVNKSDGTPIYIRKADWLAANAVVKVNGKQTDVTEDNGYFVLNAESQDEIEITMPMEVTYETTPDKTDFIAFKYGPVVLSCGLGTNDMDAVQGAGIIVYAPALDNTAITTINLGEDLLDEFKTNIGKHLVRINDSADGQVQFALKGTDQDDNLIYTPHYRQHTQRYGLYMTFAEADSDLIQQQILEKKDKLRNQEVSTAYIEKFDDNNEEHSMNYQKSSDSGTGAYNGRRYRDAKAGGWFSYELPVNTDAVKNYLCLTYTQADRGRSFDIYINDEKFVTEQIDPTGHTVTSDGFYTIKREIPAKYLTKDQLTSDGRIKVKFQSNGSLVGGVYCVAITSDYDMKAELKSLTTSVGNWDREFSPELKEYTVTVPKDTESLTLKAAPVKDSGLVYIGDILIDDTQPRTVKLAEQTTVVMINTKAQDHETTASYQLTFVKDDTQPEDMAVKNVIEQISAIGNVTLNSKTAIETARSAYEQLSTAQQEQVTNYDVLKAAEAALDVLEKADEKKKADEKEKADKSAAQSVIDQIAAIGEIKGTVDCETKISAARKAYDSLSAEQKKLVTNYKVLSDAEIRYQELKNKETEKPADEAKVGENYTVSNYKYKITSKTEVRLTGVKNKKLKAIKVANSVKIKGKTYKITAVGTSAFKGCNKATKASIGKNVKVIGKNAFSKCTKLKKVTINSKVLKEIKSKAFYNCKKLTNITIKSTKLKKVGKKAFTGINKKAKIKVPKKKLTSYKKIMKNKGQKKTVKIVKK